MLIFWLIFKDTFSHITLSLLFSLTSTVAISYIQCIWDLGFPIFLFSILAVTCLIIATELKRLSITNDSSLEIMTSTVLFSILGMGVILNLLLIIAGHQKDVSMLRLYNYYAVATLLAALVPTFILLSRKLYIEVLAAILTLALQFYVIVLVRSEVVKLERQQLLSADGRRARSEDVDVDDRVTLL